MYGIVKIGGHQYRVQAGDIIDVQKLKVEAGSEIDLDQVLFVGGENTLVGTPVVEGAKASAKVVKHDRERKKIVFKRKPGMYRKKRGHRQEYTCLVITALEDGQGNKSEIDKTSKTAEKYLK